MDERSWRYPLENRRSMRRCPAVAMATIPKYQIDATVSSSITRRFVAAMFCAFVYRSPPAITKMSELAFNQEMNSLPAGGTITRIACGSTTRNIT